MKFFITGSRNFKDENVFRRVLSEFAELIDFILIEGTKEEKELDKYIRDWCWTYAVPLVMYFPDWRPNGEYDKGAGLRKMNKIVKDSDAVIAFWDGESRGTKMAIERAVNLEKKYRVHFFKDPMNSYFIFSNRSSFLHYEYPCEIFDRAGNKFASAYEAYLKHKSSLIQSPSEVMYLVNKQKFKQHPNLMERLKKLEDKNIIFDVNFDPWGVDFTEMGIKCIEDPNRNLLGKILTKIKNG